MPWVSGFRLKAFGLHLLASAALLSLVLGSLYLGWYRWPGWYLCSAVRVAPVLVGVDLVAGPLLTLLVADPLKARRELARDIGIIVGVQLAALIYGSATLWGGRPLYYAFSEDRLQLVQASDLDPREVALARARNPQLAPHWYSLPRWVWAPLPAAAAERQAIIDSAKRGGDDVIQMPRYFRPWEQGRAALRARLQTVGQQGDIRFYRRKPLLLERLAALGVAADAPVTMMMTGRGAAPLLAVFDPATLRLRALLRSERGFGGGGR
jgi:Fe2+ transport system protein FeoA